MLADVVPNGLLSDAELRRYTALGRPCDKGVLNRVTFFVGADCADSRTVQTLGIYLRRPGAWRDQIPLGSLPIPHSRRSRLSFLFGVSFASLRLVRSFYGLEERVYTLIVPGSHHVENLLAVCPVEVVLLLSGHPLNHSVEGVVLVHLQHPHVDKTERTLALVDELVDGHARWLRSCVALAPTREPLIDASELVCL